MTPLTWLSFKREVINLLINRDIKKIKELD